MPETRLPAAVCIPSVRLEDGNNDVPGQETIVVELPSSSKFAIAWPTEKFTSPTHPLAADRTATLSSSEGDGETDISEEEPKVPPRRIPKFDEISETNFVAPADLHPDQNSIDAAPLSVPRLSRAFSMPLQSQLGSLQNLRRMAPSETYHSDSGSPQLDFGSFHELSLELADSLQMVIQTLLQLSPPQVLDPAKEQFSACSLSIPTPSISAMFTSMKNLNYMSANMAALSLDAPPSNYPTSFGLSDFDIGEMLQSVGDALSGLAAQAGVDLVLFHGDVGMKHIAVKGDESGISYTLSHVVRQVIGVASRGDSVEIGLFVEVNDDPDQSHPVAAEEVAPLRCTFHIAHRYPLNESSISESERSQPALNTLILRRLLRHVGALLETDVTPKWSSFVGRVYGIKVTLEPGHPSAVDPGTSFTPEAISGHPEFQIAQEPTLNQLTQFAESLRAKKVTLHASSKGSFAHHLSSYLTAWGMDVSHVSTEPEPEGSIEGVEVLEPCDVPAPPPSVPDDPPALTLGATRASIDPLSFVLIDDDVDVLRDNLVRVKSEHVYPLKLDPRKRPSLASNHRPKSSPQVARVVGLTPGANATSTQVVIVHFTSLSKFKLVKDAIQTILTPHNGMVNRIPEVIVIPKPAGPRRFLTALHTAVTKPLVDPFFVPTATSPSSPGLHAFSPFFSMTTAPKSPSGRSTGSIRTASDKSNRSPKEHPGDSFNVGPSSPLGQPERMEYFSDNAVRLGPSPSTGLVIQSPDGQPAGIFFHPKAKPWNTGSPADRDHHHDTERQRSASVLSSSGQDDITATRVFSSPRPRSRAPLFTADSEVKPRAHLRNGGPLPTSTTDDGLIPSSEQLRAPVPESSPHFGFSQYTPRRSSQGSQMSSPPSSPQTRHTGPTASMRKIPRRPGSDIMSQGQKKLKGTGDSNIVPPISVLIVDDNPINQTILSTFMKKKKIKYDVAKNGEEAVQKWRSGGFHLILMDIQMPVMDGIQATKEIRRLEKQNGTGGFPSTPQSEGQRTPSEGSAPDSRSSITPSYRSSVIIVALTASSLQADRVAALAAGCNDFLTKPVALEWLNNKIIEWGSIKALQLWADIRPDVVRSISSGQAAQAQNVARRLHVPEGRSTPTAPRSRSSSSSRRPTIGEGAKFSDGVVPMVERPTATHSQQVPIQGHSPCSFTGEERPLGLLVSTSVKSAELGSSSSDSVETCHTTGEATIPGSATKPPPPPVTPPSGVVPALPGDGQGEARP